MAICTKPNKSKDGTIVSYDVLEDGHTSTYPADYLTNLLKMGKMTLANMRYNSFKNEIEFVEAQ